MIESTYTLPDGSQFFFIDSGPPKDATNYTTVMILHGSAFNGFSFEKVHKYFLKNNIRSVAWNRRDYRGSSELTDADLEDLRLGRKDFLDGRAVQMAQFLVLFIEKEHIIKVNFEENTGGIALMGWSMGVASVMPFFSDPSLFGEETYNFLEPYIKNLILLDPPASSLGYPEICNQEIYDPWYDPEYQTPEEKFQGFCSWVSTYYDHPNLSINSPTFDELKRSSQDATILKWTAEEFSLFYDEKAAVRSEYHMRVPPMQFTLAEMVHHVLFDEALIQKFFPKVSVLYIWAGRSIWHCALGAIEAQKAYKSCYENGLRPRTIDFAFAEQCNHFMHCDYPEQLADIVAKGIQ